MFLELTFYSTDEKLLININRISAIYPSVQTTDIVVDGVVYAVKESYEAIAKAIYILDRLVNR